MKIIDKKIEQFANYLRRKNNLDHIQFLKVRLGIQVVASNIEKTIVVYGLAMIFHTLIYTLTTHLSYFLIRSNAHGAHAKSSLFCHMQNIILFIILPILIINLNFSLTILLLLAMTGLIIVIRYAPSATKKQPIPKRLKKRKKILSIVLYCFILVLSLIISEPLNKLMLFGICLESLTLLPIFFPKEDT
ncbi:accessory gene regulator AgrB [Staphylococcus caprae]|uniref:accessory gene regulator AgrB n=1 Tax=Staphylococcus caprae TaxID=29380 RepID=UPI003B213275